jgi:hypothetical protein
MLTQPPLSLDAAIAETLDCQVGKVYQVCRCCRSTADVACFMNETTVLDQGSSSGPPWRGVVIPFGIVER